MTGADVIALQEVERNWQRSGLADQPRELAGLLPGYDWVYGPAFDVSGGAAGGSRRQFGPMLLSRAPILSSRLHVLPKLATVRHFNMTTGALEGVIETGAGPVRVYSIHLGALSSRERLLQLDHFLAMHDRAAKEGGAWCGTPNFAADDWSNGEPPPPMPVAAIVLGDFNAEADSDEYAAMVGPMDGHLGRVPHADRFVDAWTAAGHPEDGCITFTPHPGTLSDRDRRLDYCFVTPDLMDRVRGAWVDTDAKGSDHYPVWTELDL